MKPLSGKTAIVTGSSRGIGRAIAARLAADGARTVLCARDAGALGEVARSIEIAKGVAAALPLDLRSPGSPAALADFALETFGSVDIVVNNAGATKRGEFHQLSEEDWADGFALKFFGAVRLARAAWPRLKASSGSLLNIAGIGGRTPGPQFAVGGSVNAALLALTKSMADAGVRDGVQVNAINPGSVRTERYARRVAALARERNIAAADAERELVRSAGAVRVGEPEDIAALAAFVVGPEGRFLQGALIDMDGGETKTI
jgi:3-oxoacyl-[acyl-carrier protein] reductase